MATPRGPSPIPSGTLRPAASSETSRFQPTSCFSTHRLRFIQGGPGCQVKRKSETVGCGAAPSRTNLDSDTYTRRFANQKCEPGYKHSTIRAEPPKSKRPKPH